MSYVQSKSKDSGAVTSDTMAFTSNNAAGNTIEVGVRVGAAGRTITITDSRNTFSTNNTQSDGVGDDLVKAHAENIGAGANTASVSISGAAASLRWGIVEITAAASAFDQTAKASGGQSTTPSSGNTAATTQATETLLGWIMSADDFAPSASALTPGTGWTKREEVVVSTALKLTLETREVSATGAYAADGTFDNGQSWAAIITTFKGPTAGTKAPPPFSGSRQQFTKPRRRLLFHQSPDFEASDRAIERRAA